MPRSPFRRSRLGENRSLPSGTIKTTVLVPDAPVQSIETEVVTEAVSDEVGRTGNPLYQISMTELSNIKEDLTKARRSSRHPAVQALIDRAMERLDAIVITGQ